MGKPNQQILNNIDFYKLCCKAINKIPKLSLMNKVEYYFFSLSTFHIPIVGGIVVGFFFQKEPRINILSSKEWLLIEFLIFLTQLVAFYSLSPPRAMWIYSYTDFNMHIDFIYNYARKNNISINPKHIEQFKEIVRNCLIDNKDCTYQQIFDALADDGNPLQMAIEKEREDMINHVIEKA